MTTTTEKKPIKKPATTFESTTTPVAPIAPSKTTEILDTYFDDDFQTLHKQQHAIDPSLLHKPFHIHIVNHTHAHDDHEDHDKHDVDHADERDWISHLLNEPLKSDEFKQTVSDRFCNLLNSKISSLERFNDMKELRRQIISWKTTKVCKRMSEFIDQILADKLRKCEKHDDKIDINMLKKNLITTSDLHEMQEELKSLMTEKYGNCSKMYIYDLTISKIYARAEFIIDMARFSKS